MTDEEEAREGQEVARQAVAALTEAQRRAMASGFEVVFIKDNKLIRRTPQGDVVIKTLPYRRKVKNLTKRDAS